MTSVFVAGSITIKHLPSKFVERLGNLIAAQHDVLVGDANGADKAIQKALLDGGATTVTVYCTGPEPRNNLGGWKVHHVHSDAEPGTRAFFSAKDLEMAAIADFGLMLWDAKSTGTLSNVFELTRRRKKCVVFVNRARAFSVVSDVPSLRRLVEGMSPGARNLAESKIGLSSKLDALENDQLGFTF